MKLVKIYRCLCDETRLRILHLLSHGPLCVCHVQKILRKPQVKVSKHLAYLRSQGCVESRRSRNWMIYRLPGKRSTELSANLRCLQACTHSERLFRDDVRRLRSLKCRPEWTLSPCCSNRAACAK